VAKQALPTTVKTTTNQARKMEAPSVASETTTTTTATAAAAMVQCFAMRSAVICGAQ
jgi:hypothetical protein